MEYVVDDDLVDCFLLNPFVTPWHEALSGHSVVPKNLVDVPPRELWAPAHPLGDNGIARWQVHVDRGRKEKRVNYTSTSTCP